MGKQNPKRTSRRKSTSPLKQEEQQDSTFTEIGGSPVPGLILRQVLRGHTDSIHRIAWSPDGYLLASPSRDTSVRIWEWASGNIKKILVSETWMNCAVWSPNGELFATGDEFGKVNIRSTTDWEMLW